ncbi:sensor histidine kinase [Roseibium sp. MMSF_3544]|uniref:sensor histidine kinase n=1 Tax=unclassified Roseibium TaxID=2629323 RepID=UPI00273D26D1|nr:HAMP domain-containing sensor histidine kinase [Roseibium sp. MMSF_3544]
MSGSLTSRAIAAGMIWIACALGAGGILLHGVFQESISRLFDARLESDLEFLTAMIAEAEVDPAERMKNPDFRRVYSGTYWQAQADDGRLFRSRSLWDVELQVPKTLSEGYLHEVSGPGARTVRIRARMLTMPSGTKWTLAVGRDKASLEKEVTAFRRTLMLSALALGAILLVSAILLLRFTLSPLRRLHAAVLNRQIHSGAIEGSYPAEITPLVEDLNRMLERNERLRERGRLQAANLAHALKTPAAILSNELTKARRGEVLDTELSVDAINNISAAAERHLGLVAALPDDCPEPVSIDVLPVANEVVRAIRRLYPETSLEILSDPSACVYAERSDITEILGNILDNAAKWARRSVRLILSVSEDLCSIKVEDDGPGVDEAEFVRILRQGQRLDETKSGTGLGLTIVADIVERYGGKIRMSRSRLGGLSLTVDLPSGRNRPRKHTSEFQLTSEA